MKKILLAMLLPPVMAGTQYAGIGNLNPNASAVLDVSSTSKRLLIPLAVTSYKRAAGTNLPIHEKDEDRLSGIEYFYHYR